MAMPTPIIQVPDQLSPTATASSQGDAPYWPPTKSDVGLGNVANTAPADLPVSTAQGLALGLKADLVGGKVPAAQLPALGVEDCANDFDPTVSGLDRRAGLTLGTLDGTKAWIKVSALGGDATAWEPIHST